MRSLLLAICTLLVVSVGSATTSPPKDRRGTREQPLVVEERSRSPTQEDLQRDAVHAAERTEDVRYRVEADRQRNALEGWGIAATVASAFILLVQASAFFIQARQLHRSVEEMKAATQVAQSAAESARTSADASVKANALSREAFLGEHRPWMKFSVTPLSLRYDSERAAWNLELNFELKNVGAAPAIGVVYMAQMVPHVLPSWPAEHVTEVDLAEIRAQATDVPAELQRWSEELVRSSEFIRTFTGVMFPSDDLTCTLGTSRPDQGFTDGLSRRGYGGQLLLLVGVAYKSAVDRSPHQTVIAYGLYCKTGRIALVDGNFDAGIGQLLIQPYPTADAYAT